MSIVFLLIFGNNNARVHIEKIALRFFQLAASKKLDIDFEFDAI